MKKLMTVALLLLFIGTYAQERRADKKENKSEMQDNRPDFTPEQKAELATKKMTLHLDLTESQQVTVNKLMLDQAKNRGSHAENREKRKDMTDAERFELKSKLMDEKIAFKKEMKSVLNDEQYQKWEKSKQNRRKGKMRKASKDKASRG
ncbi:hypothetical protein [Ulvibacter antarcticus]|uniref:Spy/CpxP family protein refolding chaperone n=1 Tax=Ulvibacter antarcticus TaxID=442714 RepID=A0A3L9YBD7_9FLAO|nr:hypothetical protein [Ulvibacter antarcticus]RMA57674.1 hypothetical protein BXY75_2478 [Ulvibacter antarcticus]